ncbi:A24 family peptidase [Microvirga massiliensis]|uniref:A24 family peptidase n=1 Tax=Microvirga massiliensis TaxID=1033741 RepID=UPI000660646B|nr:prepilin peptidase [Microvirga massiliensis]
MFSLSAFGIEALILATLIAVLAYIIVDDMRNFRIRNDVVLVLLALFAVFALVRGDWAWLGGHLAFGAVMFALLLGMYALGWMGGGDVKLLAVAFLWLGMDHSSGFAMFLALFTMLYVVAVKFLPLPIPKKSVSGKTRIPYGPAIACAWITTLAVS